MKVCRFAAHVASGGASSAGVRRSINLRIEAGTRRLIDDDAATLGKTRTDFMSESARRYAIDVLLDRRLFTLNADRFDDLVQVLDDPPAPGPRLTLLMRRTPAWRR